MVFIVSTRRKWSTFLTKPMLWLRAPNFREASGHEVYADVWPESGNEGIPLEAFVTPHDEAGVVVQLSNFRLSLIFIVHLAVL